MKARIGHRSIEIRDRVQGGVSVDSSSGERHGTAVEVGEPHTKDGASRNQSTEGQGNVKSGVRTHQPTNAPFTFTLTGQLPSGKNSIKTTRMGHRYPSQRFVLWRANAMSQLPAKVPHFTGPVSLIVDYVPGDQRRRDLPGMQDAIFHLLEKAKIVKDDAQVVAMIWTPFPLDREHPRCTVTIQPWREER